MKGWRSVLDVAFWFTRRPVSTDVPPVDSTDEAYTQWWREHDDAQRRLHILELEVDVQRRNQGGQ